MENLYSLKALGRNGEWISMKEYEGKIVLIVNTATECGFSPQFSELENLYQNFKEQGLVILGFPENDFGNQEPRNDKEMVEYCQVNYGVSFPLFGKSRVRGPYANEIFKFLADKKRNGRLSSIPRWNFQKYLFDRKGNLVDFYYPIMKPSSSRLRKAIQKLL